MPQVSVLMPVRDEERLLPAALKSISRQTLTDWELVAVDDGSTDATADLLQKAAARDERVCVFHRPAEGLVETLNFGLGLCRAPLIARMDADDVCHPRRLELQNEFMAASPETALAACCVRHIPRPSIQGGFKAYEDWQNSLLEHAAILRDFYVESPFAHPSVMYRRDAILEAGGYRDMGWAEDYDLWMRLMQRGARFARLPETLLYWRDRPQRLSRTGRHCTLDAFRACKLHYLKKDFLKNVTEVTLWGAGHEGKAWRKLLSASGINVTRWLEVDARKIGQVIHGAPVTGIETLKPEGDKILVTIGAKGARQQVRGYAEGRGLIEGRHYICVT